MLAISLQKTSESLLNQLVRLVAPTGNNWGFLAYAYGKAGRRADAEKLMADRVDALSKPSRSISICAGICGAGRERANNRAVRRHGESRPRAARPGSDLSGVCTRAR